MRNINRTETRVTKNCYIFVPKDLDNCTHVFVRIDKVKPSLYSSYDGPSKVCKRLRSFLVVDIKGTNTSISIDRLKPALCILKISHF